MTATRYEGEHDDCPVDVPHDHPGSSDERCPTCGQPDNCGDCDHTGVRFAAVTGARSAEEVVAYMPANYEVYGHRFPDGPSGKIVVLIRGVDEAGWTLDDYVRPRLWSGMMACTEVVA